MAFSKKKTDILISNTKITAWADKWYKANEFENACIKVCKLQQWNSSSPCINKNLKDNL